MRVFNTGAAHFWHSPIGQQIRFLGQTSFQYQRTKPIVRTLVERMAQEAFQSCRLGNCWPTITAHNDAIRMTWQGRGEVAVFIDGTKVVYTPDPVRRSGTINMMLFVNSLRFNQVRKFAKRCVWHMLEAHP